MSNQVVSAGDIDFWGIDLAVNIPLNLADEELRYDFTASLNHVETSDLGFGVRGTEAQAKLTFFPAAKSFHNKNFTPFTSIRAGVRRNEHK